MPRPLPTSDMLRLALLGSPAKPIRLRRSAPVASPLSRVLAKSAEWDEGKHKRNHGQFSSGGDSSAPAYADHDPHAANPPAFHAPLHEKAEPVAEETARKTSGLLAKLAPPASG